MACISGGTGGGAAGASDVAMSSELEASRQEMAILKEELQQSRANCEHLRTEIQVGPSRDASN